MRARRFIQNAAILCITSVGLRLIGIFFNAYLIGKIGASGIGLFQLVMSVYLIFITLASSGVSMATTRLVAEELAKGSTSGVRAAVKKTFVYSVILGCLALFAMFSLAEHIGTKWLGDERTISSLRILAVSLPFIAMSSVLKGYFMAVRRVSRSSAVEIAAQLLNMAVIIYLMNSRFPDGLEYACNAIAVGGGLAEVFSFVMLYGLHLIDRRRFGIRDASYTIPSSRILKISLPLAINAYLRAGFSSVSKLLVPTSLQQYGMSKDEALTQYGILHGMAFPIIQLPEMLLLSIASLLVPELADLHERKDKVRIHRSLNTILQTTFLFSIGTIGVFSCFAKDISQLVYSNTSAALYIACLGPLALFMYLDKMVDSALTGLNEQVNSMFNNILESAFTTVFILLLVPKMGMVGYIIVLFAGKALNMFLSISRLVRVSEISIPFMSWIICPVVAMLLSIFTILLAKKLPYMSVASWGIMALALIGLYVLQLWMMGCLRKPQASVRHFTQSSKIY